MIIIFGLRVVFSTLGDGLFHCPHRGGDVIPLTKAGELAAMVEQEVAR